MSKDISIEEAKIQIALGTAYLLCHATGHECKPRCFYAKIYNAAKPPLLYKIRGWGCGMLRVVLK